MLIVEYPVPGTSAVTKRKAKTREDARKVKATLRRIGFAPIIRNANGEIVR